MPYFNAALAFLLAIPLGLGIGGGGLFLVYLGDVLALPRGGAVYLNLLFFICALLAAACAHVRAGRLRFPLLAVIFLFSAPTALLGRVLAASLPAWLLRLFLGAFLLASGIFSLYSLKKSKVADDSLDKPAKKHYNNKE